MVAPSNANIAKFLSAPTPNIWGYLFYGTDDMHIASRASILSASLKKKNGQGSEIIRLHDTDLANDAQRILSEVGMRSLFGDRNILWLTSLPVKAQTIVLEASTAGQAEVDLIIQASDLKKSHKLVQAFEAAPHLAVIACYGEDKASLNAAIKQKLTLLGHDAESDAITAIGMKSGFSLSIAEQEANKLSSYVGQGRRVTLQDVEACLKDYSTAESYDAVDAALDGKKKIALIALDRFVARDANVTPLLMALSSSLQRLHVLKSASDGGTPAAQMIKTLRPPVFYKQQEIVLKQLQFWTRLKLVIALRQTNDAIKISRLKPQLAVDITVTLFLKITQLAGARER